MSNLGIQNTATGDSALRANTTGYYNSAVGVDALLSNTTGYYNSAVGVSALRSNTTGYSNSAVGAGALRSNTTGFNNVAVGVSALRSNTTGYSNSAVGVSALLSNTTGFNNVAVGVNALLSNTTGFNNVALGFDAAYYETGSNKLFIDNQTRANEADARIKALIYGVFDAAVINQFVLVNGAIKQNDSILIHSTQALANGAGTSAATLTNAPAATNPTKWIPIDDNGIIRYVPAW